MHSVQVRCPSKQYFLFLLKMDQLIFIWLRVKLTECVFIMLHVLSQMVLIYIFSFLFVNLRHVLIQGQNWAHFNSAKACLSNKMAKERNDNIQFKLVVKLTQDTKWQKGDKRGAHFYLCFKIDLLVFIWSPNNPTHDLNY